MVVGSQFALKLVLTAGVCGLIAWSLARPDHGILAELRLLGPQGAGLLAAGFLLAVVAYARDLQHLLQALPPAHRAAPPHSVWFMLLLPWNFVEDFWIVAHVAASLKSHAGAGGRPQAGSGRFGLISGLGWCALQILSLVPLPLGSLAGLLALPLWLWHWAYVRRARDDVLAASAP